MAITATKLISQSFGDGSAPALVQQYRMVSDTSLDIEVPADYATLCAGLKGGIYPLKSFITPQVDTNQYGRLRLRTFSFQPVPGSENKIYDATLRWDSMYVWTKISLGGGTDRLALPVSIDFDATPRQVTMYRSGTFGTPPSANLNTTADIGGTKVDYASRPVMGSVPQVTVRVGLIFDCSRASPGMTLVSAYDRISAIIGKWNSDTFLHWNANQVYCESANVAPIRDEFYRISYVLKWDQWYGCEQVPKTDVNGRAAVDANGSANVVTWKSFVGGTYAFAGIFNDQPNNTLAAQWAKEGSWLTYP